MRLRLVMVVKICWCQATRSIFSLIHPYANSPCEAPTEWKLVSSRRGTKHSAALPRKSRPSQSRLIVGAINNVYFNGGLPAAVVAVVAMIAVVAAVVVVVVVSAIVLHIGGCFFEEQGILSASKFWISDQQTNWGKMFSWNLQHASDLPTWTNLGKVYFRTATSPATEVWGFRNHKPGPVHANSFFQWGPQKTWQLRTVAICRSLRLSLPTHQSRCGCVSPPDFFLCTGVVDWWHSAGYSMHL